MGHTISELLIPHPNLDHPCVLLWPRPRPPEQPLGPQLKSILSRRHPEVVGVAGLFLLPSRGCPARWHRRIKMTALRAFRMRSGSLPRQEKPRVSNRNVEGGENLIYRDNVPAMNPEGGGKLGHNF